ncbi:patatin-like phospholipase family protein [Dongia sp. agr-C8]
MLLFALTGCEALLRQPAPTDRAPPVLEGFKDVRYYPMNPALPPPPSVGEAFLNEPADSYERNPDSLVYNYLAVSGGGSDGAFGAGLLNGWTRSGTRPKFKFVTGVSTGALIAPFAFLGPDYDETLQQAYTTVDAQRLYLARSLVSLLWEESLNDNKPFRDMIAKYVDEKVLGRIAEEHRKGRRLYVLTTDLDREEPVVWDMGAIAASNSPARLDLFRKVILASASIPAFFPPVLINVKIDDVQKDELHVDGGVFAQSFFVGNQIDLRALERRAHPEWQGKITHRLYVIRNGRLDPQPRKVDRSLGSITAYSIDSMLKASGINDLYRLYLGDLAGELELRYVAIPHDYVPSSLDEFNQAEMIRQYNLGLAMGEKGIPWQRTPPGWQK